ncbi:MAG TPA: twin-arginine translocation signal domain-containing protein, partial [Candidatus Polarisedimenticolia bacterium]|nr:twin-arginine translocation signal domain-containing protein [Candidatus Polarisedimenticolia bacterium]
MSHNLSRRTFLQTATAATAAAYASHVLPAWAAVDRGTVATNTQLTTFAYSEVELFDSPMKRQFEENHARFLNLDDDRLLKVFRQVAGLPA